MYSGIFVKLNFLAFGLRFVGILKWLAYSENSDNWTDYEYKNVYNGNVLSVLQIPAYLVMSMNASMRRLLDIL